MQLLNFDCFTKLLLTKFFFWRSPEKFLWRPCCFFLREHLRLCPWSSLALASSIPVLGLESVCPRKGCPWPWPRIFFVSLALASSLVSSTPPLLIMCNLSMFEALWLSASFFFLFFLFCCASSAQLTWLERSTLASRVSLFLLCHFPTNECEISDFCLLLENGLV